MFRHPCQDQNKKVAAIVAEAVADLRTELGISQEELGHLVGATGRTVYRWEKEKSVPGHRHLVNLRMACPSASSRAKFDIDKALEADHNPPISRDSANPVRDELSRLVSDCHRAIDILHEAAGQGNGTCREQLHSLCEKLIKHAGDAQQRSAKKSP